MSCIPNDFLGINFPFCIAVLFLRPIPLSITLMFIPVLTSFIVISIFLNPFVKESPCQIAFSINGCKIKEGIFVFLIEMLGVIVVFNLMGICNLKFSMVKYKLVMSNSSSKDI